MHMITWELKPVNQNLPWRDLDWDVELGRRDGVVFELEMRPRVLIVSKDMFAERDLDFFDFDRVEVELTVGDTVG